MAPPPMVKWVNKMRILGVFFSNGLVSVDQDNWKSKLDQLKSVLNLWSSQELSFVGCSMILNVLRASRQNSCPPCLGFGFLKYYLAFHLEGQNGVHKS